MQIIIKIFFSFCPEAEPKIHPQINSHMYHIYAIMLSLLLFLLSIY